MDRLGVRWLRLAVVGGAIAGSALVSSSVLAENEPLPIDVPVVIEVAAELPLEDIEVIEMVIVESDVVESAVTAPDVTDAPLGDTASDVEVGEALSNEAVDSAPVGEVVSDEPVAESIELIDDALHEEGSDDEGHQNGNVGEGRPYLVTFEVEWLDPQGTPIGNLDAVLAIDWRSLFELSADSMTGQGATSAICTYPAGSAVLQCVFDTAGHGSGPEELDGLIVPGSKHAQYAVTVAWPSVDWTIEHANDGPYSARQACPRGQGGGGHDDGGGGHHEADGHDDGDDHGDDDHGDDHGDDDHGGGQGGGGQGGGQGGGDDAARRTVPCDHRVVMRQIALVVPPAEPPAVRPQPDVTQPTVPEDLAPVVPDVLPPVAPADQTPPVAVASRALPATGSSISVLLLLAGLIVGAGSTFTALSRRTR
jgi:LPXTG-motif cell wall-anchored protein